MSTNIHDLMDIMQHLSEMRDVRRERIQHQPYSGVASAPNIDSSFRFLLIQSHGFLSPRSPAPTLHVQSDVQITEKNRV